MPEEYLTNAINGLVSDDMRTRGECPGNLSFWNPGEEYKSFMTERLAVPMEQELFDYLYSCSLEVADQVLGRLGAEGQPDAVVSFTSSSTVSIVHVVNLLKFSGIRRVCILAPAYFSVRSCCRAFGLDFEVIPLVRDGAYWQVPVARILKGGFDAIWATSPVYGMGEEFSDEMLGDILRLRDDCDLAVIFDESLALPGQELVRRVTVDDSTVFIYSPHKAVSVNSRKFSALVYDRRFLDSFNDWTDVFGGALPRSCIGAVYHYISDNYHEVCVPAYLDFIRRREADLAAAIAAFPGAWTAVRGSGHYRTVFTGLPMPADERAVEIVERVRERTGYLFYPSTANGFTRELGLAFRVNLLLDRNDICEGVGAVLSALMEIQ